MNSDSESNVSAFINYNEKRVKQLYASVVENMDVVNQDLLQIESNLKHIVKDAGQLENQLTVVLQSLPKFEICLLVYMSVTVGEETFVTFELLLTICYVSGEVAGVVFVGSFNIPDSLVGVIACVFLKMCLINIKRNWVEDSIKCPKNEIFQFLPKQEVDLAKLERETGDVTRVADFRLNKLHGVQGDTWVVIRHDNYATSDNYASTNDLVYNHLPKPLCGPVYRTYRPMEHMFIPQPDLMKCFGNVTEWGLRKFKLHEWACTRDSDYMSSSYNETFTAPRQDQSLRSTSKRFGRNA
ncbi:hypothetical protein EVAR_26014_1 [Eumeta japonica]|uniref:Uncharacterized protein n=1 Tax=Eumeta variegata TaxID=151549 RepID=A0A4C1VSZ1_EUMVA|nr:hypothetical protein EVAR_26014_1 [Eumeta japonica]